MSRRSFLSLLVLTLSLGVFACATTPIQIDASLEARADPMPVRRSSFLWREGLAFGPFEVKLSSGIPWALVSGDLADAGLASQGHRFEITDGSSSIHATCRTRRRPGWVIGNLPRPALVQCSLRPNGEQEAWTLVVQQAGLMRIKGALERENGMADVEIESVNRREDVGRDLERPIGYTLIRGDAVVGAVDRNGGRVWIDRGLAGPDRLRVATTAAALVLFKPWEE